MARRTVFVSGAGAGFGRGLAAGLEQRGATVADLGHVADLSSREEVDAALAGAAAAVGPADAVVHAAVATAALEAVPVAELDDERVEVVWEQALRSTLLLLQGTHRHFAGRGGRVLLVTPTIALSGAAGLGLYAAAAEAQRLLAKSAARQWGSDGITVNCIAPAAVTMGVAEEGLGAVTLSPPALGRTGDVAGDIAPVVDFLLGPDAHFVTGATLSLDGGAWLTP